MVARSSVLDGLGVKTEDMVVGDTVLATFVSSDPVTGMTSVPGVYVAGNISDPQAHVVTAAAAAVRTAAMINMDLVSERANRFDGAAG
jgi:thioredoxin reductase